MIEHQPQSPSYSGISVIITQIVIYIAIYMCVSGPSADYSMSKFKDPSQSDDPS